MSAIGNVGSDLSIMRQVTLPIELPPTNILQSPFDARVVEDIELTPETPTLPTLSPTPRQQTNCLRMVARRVGRVVIPITTLVVLSSIPTAAAGPGLFAACIAGCSAAGPFAPACYAACLAALTAPTP